MNFGGPDVGAEGPCLEPAAKARRERRGSLGICPREMLARPRPGSRAYRVDTAAQGEESRARDHQRPASWSAVRPALQTRRRVSRIESRIGSPPRLAGQAGQRWGRSAELKPASCCFMLGGSQALGLLSPPVR